MPSDSSENPTSAPEPNDEGSFETVAFTKQSTSQLLADRYRLIQPLGEGGMGTVWLAEQREPVKRNVAVKLIKAGLDNKAVVARFEAERQALAMMDHPNIAKILDGGLSESGAPYFVMELVKGTPLTEYCDAKKLNLSERLKLFVPVCQAIQHAHQKGIIHRDIKPSNILVAQYDDQAVPKVIDFGVAKATGGVLTEKTLNTGFGIVGTPQYMSPEQATLNQLDIDTRSDIYSLGVVLYELLTGSPPFKADELHQAGYMEILRVIREVEPPRPSTRVSTAEGLPQIAKTRNVEPTKLSVLLRTELDWVVMKALEKDRIRRYETASDFASDIERYLTGEPVQAHPPSRGYRLRKFLRKNRGPAIAVGVTSLALFAGVIGTTTAMLEAHRQRSVAETKQREAENERKRADQERDDAITAREQATASAKAEAEQRARAEKSAEAALAAYRASTDESIEQLIGSKQLFTEVEKRYLRSAADRWIAFAESQDDSIRGKEIKAEANAKCGKIFRTFSIYDEAEAKFRESLKIQEELQVIQPDKLKYQIDSLQRRYDIALVHFHQSSSVETVREFQIIVEDIATNRLEQLENVEIDFLIAHCHFRMAILLMEQVMPEESDAHWDRCIAILRRINGSTQATKEISLRLSVALRMQDSRYKGRDRRSRSPAECPGLQRQKASWLNWRQKIPLTSMLG